MNSTQLRLFDVPEQSAGPRRIGQLGALSVRQDHAVLGLITLLIGVSVVFALGVERGKQLTRSEQRRIETTPTVSSGSKPAAPAVSISEVTDVAVASAPKASPTPTQTASKKSTKTDKPEASIKKPTATAAAASKRKFAIQVVSYNTSMLAQRELEQLQQRGEQAFLIKKQNKVVLFVGPFSSKERAREQLSRLKQRYQDCFLQHL